MMRRPTRHLAAPAIQYPFEYGWLNAPELAGVAVVETPDQTVNLPFANSLSNVENPTVGGIIVACRNDASRNAPRGPKTRAGSVWSTA